MEFEFSIVTGKVIHRLLFQHLDECMEVVREAYIDHHHGDSVNPSSFFLLFPKKPTARIIGLPAYLGGRFDVSGIKWIASYPENVRNKFPRASAALLLNSYETGYPFACMESSIISAARTAASAILAASNIHPNKKVRCLGIVGTGFIARYVYRFLIRSGWDIETLKLFDLNPSDAQKFKELAERSQDHRAIEVAPSLDDLLCSSDLILLTTTAAKPYIIDKSLFSHRPTILNLSLRDIAPEIILQSFNIVDDIDHVMNANTSPHLAEKMCNNRDFVTGTIAQLVTRECHVDQSKPIIVSPFGLGILDLAVGKWLYDLAVKKEKVIRIDNFFYEVER